MSKPFPRSLAALCRNFVGRRGRNVGMGFATVAAGGHNGDNPTEQMKPERHAGPRTGGGAGACRQVFSRTRRVAKGAAELPIRTRCARGARGKEYGGHGRRGGWGRKGLGEGSGRGGWGAKALGRASARSGWREKVLWSRFGRRRVEGKNFVRPFVDQMD